MLVIGIRGDIPNDDTLKPSNLSAKSFYPGMSHSQGLVGTHVLGYHSSPTQGYYKGEFRGPLEDCSGSRDTLSANSGGYRAGRPWVKRHVSCAATLHPAACSGKALSQNIFYS